MYLCLWWLSIFMKISHQTVLIHGRRGGICVSVSSLATPLWFSVPNKVSFSLHLFLYMCMFVCACVDESWLWLWFALNGWSGPTLICVLEVGFCSFGLFLSFTAEMFDQWKKRLGWRVLASYFTSHTLFEGQMDWIGFKQFILGVILLLHIVELSMF